jgi:hypothetical protein
MITVTFTDAEANMVRQALRAEHDRMVRQGYANLAKVVNEARDALSNAVIDRNLLLINSEVDKNLSVG